ncbi:MAG TPA: VOC family protein [Acidimicrobiia bacterium]|jgi:catechol 2,3-dioxygenase-like lactoylglutathione lyase family enzyme
MLSSFAISPTLSASDMTRARDFYENTLGFSPTWLSEGGESVFYESGGVAFEVHFTPAAGTNEATAAQWHVDNLRLIVSELRSKGVVFEDYDFGAEMRTVDGILSLADGTLGAWFKDTEGNILGVFQTAG